MLFFTTFALVGVVFFYLVYLNSHYCSSSVVMTRVKVRNLSLIITIIYFVILVSTLMYY